MFRLLYEFYSDLNNWLTGVILAIELTSLIRLVYWLSILWRKVYLFDFFYLAVLVLLSLVFMSESWYLLRSSWLTSISLLNKCMLSLLFSDSLLLLLPLKPGRPLGMLDVFGLFVTLKLCWDLLEIWIMFLPLIWESNTSWSSWYS